MRVYQAAHTGLPSVVTGVIALGAAWSLRGSAAGVEWLVAEGVGSGSVVAVSDPAAPLDVPVSYSLRVGQSAPTSAVFTRRLADGFADTVLTSVDGRSSVEVLWEGKAPGTLNPRASYAEPLASRWPRQTLQPAPVAPSWGIDFRVDTDRVGVARSVIEAGLLWVVHSHVRCEPCPLPQVMLAGVVGTVGEESWPDGRLYSVKLQQLEPAVSGVPVVTWGEARAAGVVWGPGTSFASIRRLIAGE